MQFESTRVCIYNISFRIRVKILRFFWTRGSLLLHQRRRTKRFQIKTSCNILGSGLKESSRTQRNCLTYKDKKWCS